MTTTTRDLWPSDIATLPTVGTPVSILREQASLLGEKTDNLVEGEVRSQGDKSSQFVHTFYLVAPALDNYRHPLFTVTHKIELYPVAINFSNRVLQALDETQFINQLKTIFSDEKTKKVIQALRAQSLT